MTVELGLVEALELIAGDRCERTHMGKLGTCFSDGRTVDARYGADRACDACIAWVALEANRDLTERAREIQLQIEPITTFASSGFFRRMVSSLVDQVVRAGDVEMAVQCLDVLDAQRKRLDRMQATPPTRRSP